MFISETNVLTCYYSKCKIDIQNRLQWGENIRKANPIQRIAFLHLIIWIWTRFSTIKILNILSALLASSTVNKTRFYDFLHKSHLWQKFVINQRTMLRQIGHKQSIFKDHNQIVIRYWSVNWVKINRIISFRLLLQVKRFLSKKNSIILTCLKSSINYWSERQFNSESTLLTSTRWKSAVFPLSAS